MHRLIAALILSALPAFADDTTTSGLIAEKGLAATREQLEAEPASPDRNMALSAVRFLSGIELAYQERWRIGSTSPLLPGPIMGTDLISVNPSPDEMQSDFLNKLAAEIAGSMQSVRELLPEAQGALVLNLPDLWFDIDGDGQRAPNESLLDLAMLPLPEGVDGKVRFDAADAEWLRAYTHLIEAVCTLVIAFDPEPALARHIDLTEALKTQLSEAEERLSPENLNEDYLESHVIAPIVDMIAVFVHTLRHDPDKAMIREAKEHLLEMIAANQSFWTMIAEETDDADEWIPNDNQQAALGFDIPEGAGPAWLAVLEDTQKVLDGDKLVPYWRFAPGYGIDIQKWIDDPQPVDLVSWVHGSAALPYIEQGEVIELESIDNFTRMFGGGRAGLYMILFN